VNDTLGERRRALRAERLVGRRERAKKFLNGRSDLRWRLGALAPGETIEVPVEDARWEALNSARKRATDDTDLKYRIRQSGDNWVVLAYDPRLEKPSLAAMIKAKSPPKGFDEDRLREMVRQIVREEFAHLL
jgi:hypothetical protein